MSLWKVFIQTIVYLIFWGFTLVISNFVNSVSLNNKWRQEQDQHHLFTWYSLVINQHSFFFFTYTSSDPYFWQFSALFPMLLSLSEDGDVCLFLNFDQRLEDEDWDLDDVLFLLDLLLLFSPLYLCWSALHCLALLFPCSLLSDISTVTLKHSMIILPVTLQIPPFYPPVFANLSPMQAPHSILGLTRAGHQHKTKPRGSLSYPHFQNLGKKLYTIWVEKNLPTLPNWLKASFISFLSQSLLRPAT